MEFRGLRRLRSTREHAPRAVDCDQTGDPVHPGDPVQPNAPVPSGESADEYDTPAEVDATFRTLRRVALGYAIVFVVIVGAVPGLTVALDWWSEGRLIGGMSPNFVMAAFGLYLFFFVLGVAAATLSTAVEARMLGGPDRHTHERQGTSS